MDEQDHFVSVVKVGLVLLKDTLPYLKAGIHRDGYDREQKHSAKHKFCNNQIVQLAPQSWHLIRALRVHRPHLAYVLRLSN